MKEGTRQGYYKVAKNVEIYSIHLILSKEPGKTIRKFKKKNWAFIPVSYLLTYLLTYLLHGAEYYLKSCHSAYQNYPAFLIEPKGSPPCSQKPATRPYPKPAESSSPHRSPSPKGAS
jgi:hypothetical protein